MTNACFYLSNWPLDKVSRFKIFNETLSLRVKFSAVQIINFLIFNILSAKGRLARALTVYGIVLVKKSAILHAWFCYSVPTGRARDKSQRHRP